MAVAGVNAIECVAGCKLAVMVLLSACFVQNSIRVPLFVTVLCYSCTYNGWLGCSLFGITQQAFY